jgi:hypothetical protein
MFLSCNPKKNWTYREFYQKDRNGTLEKGKKFIQSFYYDNPYLPKSYELQLQSRSKIQRERLLNGNWEYDDNTNKIFDYDKLQMLEDNRIEPSDRMYITVDIAGLGKDLAVFTVWKGLEVVHIEAHQKTTATDIIRITEGLAQNWRVQNNFIVFDAEGLGFFAADFVRGARAFRGSSSPIEQKSKNRDTQELYKQNYKNLRSQCFFKLAELVNSQKIRLVKSTFIHTIIEELDAIEDFNPDEE